MGMSFRLWQAENAELKRRLLAAEKYKEQLRESKYSIGKLEYKARRRGMTLEIVQSLTLT